MRPKARALGKSAGKSASEPRPGAISTLNRKNDVTRNAGLDRDVVLPTAYAVGQLLAALPGLETTGPSRPTLSKFPRFENHNLDPAVFSALRERRLR